MSKRNDRWISEDQALAALDQSLINCNRAESWLVARIDRTHLQALNSQSYHRSGCDRWTHQGILDGSIPITRVSVGEVLSGRELVLCGPRTDYRSVMVRADLISGTIEARATFLDSHVEADRLARLQSSDDTLAARVRTGHENGLCTGHPIGHAGMVGDRSEVARYPLGTPGCAAGQSRRPLASPGPYGLLQSGWTGLDIGGLARVDAIGGRQVQPQYHATVARRTRRGKKGGRRHK